LIWIIRDSNWAIKKNCPQAEVFTFLKIENFLFFNELKAPQKMGENG